MTIRRATADDAAEACAVIRRSIAELCHPDHGGEEARLQEWLSNKTDETVRRWIANSYFLVAEHADRIVGVAAMTADGKITLNYVDPAVRFRGVSKALLLSIEAHARSAGITTCVLESTRTALPFYLALGYVGTGSHNTVLSKLL